ncbi:MAG: fibronectin type III domain-containing protein [Planctomycetota bacterium]
MFAKHLPALIRYLSVPCLLCPLAWMAQAHDGEDHSHSVRPLKPAEMYAPGLMPDRIVLTWAGDPTTTQSVTWRTSTEVAAGKAELARATAGPELRNEAKSFDAVSTALKTDLSTAHYHSVTFKDLTPGTKYAYRVGDGTNWSEWFHFSTARVEQEPFSFIYFGDAQNDIRSMWSRVIREAYSDAPKAKFLLHAGDLINNAQSDGEWGEWFGAGHWLNAMIPNVPVVGNHEQHKVNDTKRQLTHHWRPQFTLPEHGPEGLEETCYTFEYQNTRFVILDSNTKIQEQAKWLDEVLSKNTKPWIVCSFHHPVFSTAKDRDNPLIRAAWKPILDKYNVDLVLQGHDHSYGRTGLDTPSVPPETLGNVPVGVTARDEHHGTVYVVSVSGPKMYNVTQKPFMVRMAEDTQLYQVIHIDGMSLRYEARTAIGELYDAFVLEKKVGEPNRMTEATDLMAQRLRSNQAAASAAPVGVPAAGTPVPAK